MQLLTDILNDKCRVVTDFLDFDVMSFKKNHPFWYKDKIIEYSFLDKLYTLKVIGNVDLVLYKLNDKKEAYPHVYWHSKAKKSIDEVLAKNKVYKDDDVIVLYQDKEKPIEIGFIKKTLINDELHRPVVLVNKTNEFLYTTLIKG